MKILIAVLLVMVLISLFSGLFFMYKDKDNNAGRTLKALKIRIGLSITIFLIVMASHYVGYIK